MFGEKNASKSFDLATFKNHYFLYNTVPVSRYYLKNCEAIREYGIKHNWSIEKCQQVNKHIIKKNAYVVDRSKCLSMSSLEFLRC